MTENPRGVSQVLKLHNYTIYLFLFVGLKSHPGYSIAKRQWSGCSGMLSFYIKGGIEESKVFLKKLKYFHVAESLGGFESLAEIP